MVKLSIEILARIFPVVKNQLFRMSAAKVPTVAPIYGSQCAEKLMATALSVNCGKLFKRILLASAYPMTAIHIEKSHESWAALGFEKKMVFHEPNEMFKDTFLDKSEQMAEWKNSINASAVVSAMSDLPWSDEHIQLMAKFSDHQAT